MRALTIRQPWASLIALGIKHYETRSWSTNVRGRIAIHAGATPPHRVGYQGMCGPYLIPRTEDGLLIMRGGVRIAEAALGCVLATAELVDCHLIGAGPLGRFDLTQQEYQLGDWTDGRFAWEIANVVPLAEPIPAKGKQGWWEWTPPSVEPLGVTE